MTLKSKGITLGAIFALLLIGCVFGIAARVQTGLKAGFDSEFLTRPDGYKGLKKAYDFEFSTSPMHLAPGMMYYAVRTGQVDVICGFLTDGRIEAYDLKVLKDDRNFFPPYDACPLLNGATLKKYPQLRDILGKLAGEISTPTMRELNYRHDRHEGDLKPRKIAYNFLVERNLIAPDEKGDGSAGTITVGGKNFTEQDIIGEMMAILIEHHSDIAVRRKLSLGGTMICFNALRSGDLDLYAEYTGTGLVSILDRPAISDSQKVWNIVSDEFDKKWNLIWGRSFGFNNTYTLTMRAKQADELGIDTISDLAEHVRSEK